MTRRMSTDKVLRVGNLNPLVLNAEYAVRGKVAIRAEELRKVCDHLSGPIQFDFTF